MVAVLLVSTTAPGFRRTLTRLQAERAAFELAQVARYAHARAVSDGTEVRLEWSEDERRAVLSAVPEQGPPVQLTEPAASSRTLPETLTLQVTGGAEATPCACVRLFPDGTSDGATLTVGWDGRMLRVVVDETTSRVTVVPGPPAR